MKKEVNNQMRSLLVDALKDLHYKKRNAYKKHGMPETMEEIEQCKIALAELKEIETLEQEIAMGTVTVEYEDKPEDTIAKEDENNEAKS